MCLPAIPHFNIHAERLGVRAGMEFRAANRAAEEVGAQVRDGYLIWGLGGLINTAVCAAHLYEACNAVVCGTDEVLTGAWVMHES